MDTVKSADEVINCISLSNDVSRIFMGSNLGVKLRKVCRDFGLDISSSDFTYKDVYIAEILDMQNSQVGIVTRSFPNKLRIFNMQKDLDGELFQEFSYPEKILSVKSNSVHLVTCLEDSIYIHNRKDMPIFKRFYCSPNSTGMFSLSDDNLAYPQSGMVKTLFFNDMTPGLSIDAHESPIVAMILTKKGNLIATASEKGATIRLFDTVLGAKLKEFRYGTADELIYSLSFSEDNKYIIGSLNGGTLPIFEIGSTELLTSGDVILEESAFATASLPISGQRTISAFRGLKVAVVSFEEVVYIYKLNPLEGGECRHLKTSNLKDGSLIEIEDDETIEGFVHL